MDPLSLHRFARLAALNFRRPQPICALTPIQRLTFLPLAAAMAVKNCSPLSTGEISMRFPAQITFRTWQPTDSLPAITALLHAAYAPLARQGMRFHASHQGDDVTLERLSSGHPLVALLEGEIVATITRYGPDAASPCAWFRHADVHSLGQFAVRPDLQGLGLGRRMYDLAESEAREHGCRRLALDTAEPATQLIAWYERLGFRIVDHAQWDVTNYRSVVMIKELPE
jgi:ribosomal protein S18 acetylase RimI-like enzyme